MEKLPEKWAVKRTADNYKQVNDIDYDDLFNDAAIILVREGQASTSLLQRKLKLGYNRAGRIMEQLIQDGIVSGEICNRKLNITTGKQLCEHLKIEYKSEDWQKEQNSDGWVKCSERLPDYGERVLCMHQSFGVQIGWIMNPKIWAFSNGLHQLFDSVTHWRELPAPPIN